MQTKLLQDLLELRRLSEMLLLVRLGLRLDRFGMLEKLNRVEKRPDHWWTILLHRALHCTEYAHRAQMKAVSTKLCGAVDLLSQSTSMCGQAEDTHSNTASLHSGYLYIIYILYTAVLITEPHVRQSDAR